MSERRCSYCCVLAILLGSMEIEHHHLPDYIVLMAPGTKPGACFSTAEVTAKQTDDSRFRTMRTDGKKHLWERDADVLYYPLKEQFVRWLKSTISAE